MNSYCFGCKNEQNVKIVRKKEVFKVKGDPIEIYSDVMICSICGEEIFNETLDEKTMARVYEEYRNLRLKNDPGYIQENEDTKK